MRFRMGFCILILMACFAVPGTVRAEPARTVTVGGEGTVAAVPDRAAFTVSIMAEQETAARAIDAAAKNARSVLAALKADGVSDDDVQTGSISLHPVHARPTGNGAPPRLIGYRASLSQTVRVTDLDALGPVMDAVVKAGGTGLNGLRFFIANDHALKDRARARAMADAKRAAGVLAEAAGAGLGVVVSISETETGGGPRPMMALRTEAAGALPMAPGNITVAVRVRVVYELTAK